MKQRSTTPVSAGYTTKSVLVAAAIVMALGAPIAVGSRVLADRYDDQIKNLRTQMDQYNSRASELDVMASTLEGQLAKISAEKNDIIAQINLSQQQYDQLQQQIEATKQKIQANRDALGDVVADMYVEDDISPLEMLASSDNLSDYLDKQTYRASMQEALTAKIKEISSLKEKLEDSKAKVEAVLKEQQGQKAQLAAKEAQQQRIVDQTRGEEAAYQKLVNDAAAQMAAVAAQQRAYYESLKSQGVAVDSGVIGSFVYANWTGDLGCIGGYPTKWCGTPDTKVDDWKLYNRECVSYGAWAMETRFGKLVNSFAGRGHAYQWTQSGPENSGAWRTYDPQPGDAVVLPKSAGVPYGHLMIVESVSGDWVHVSQYNWYGLYGYSEMDIKKTGVIFLRFPNR